MKGQDVNYLLKNWKKWLRVIVRVLFVALTAMSNMHIGIAAEFVIEYILDN